MKIRVYFLLSFTTESFTLEGSFFYIFLIEEFFNFFFFLNLLLVKLEVLNISKRVVLHLFGVSEINDLCRGESSEGKKLLPEEVFCLCWSLSSSPHWASWEEWGPGKWSA